MAPSPHERHERHAHQQREPQEQHVDWDGVVVEGLVRGGVEGGLAEVEQARETDDQPVDFAEGGEAEDFGGVIAGVRVSWGFRRKGGGGLTTRRCSTRGGRGRRA